MVDSNQNSLLGYVNLKNTDFKATLRASLLSFLSLQSQLTAEIRTCC